MKYWIKKRIKKMFSLYDREDFEKALNSIPTARDREDLEWKIRQKMGWK